MNGKPPRLCCWSSQFLLRLGIMLAMAVAFSAAARPGHSDAVIPADPPLNWWKGNLHTHSFWSDGSDFPEMIAEWYRTHGYNFLALSDHNILSEASRWKPFHKIDAAYRTEVLQKYVDRFGMDWVETRGTRETDSFEIRLKPLTEFRSLVEERGRFLMIPSEEISARAPEGPVHVNATNIKEVIFPLEGETAHAVLEANLRAVHEQAKRTGREILPHLNHPNYGYTFTAEILAAVTADKFFEVYNGHMSVNHLGDADHPSMERMWDIANTIRVADLHAPPLYGIATDDSHNYHGNPHAVPGRGWVMVRCRHLTPEKLIAGLRSGDFYASAGVVLSEVRFDEQAQSLEIRIQPEDGVAYTTEFIGTLVDYDASSEPRTDAEGNPIHSTRKYSADVGQVFSRQTGTSPAYQLTGGELYVRAVVTSDHAHPVPSFEGHMEQAWTQPVGWRKRLEEMVSNAPSDVSEEPATEPSSEE